MLPKIRELSKVSIKAENPIIKGVKSEI